MHMIKKSGERTNEPLADNTIQNIDPNDNDIDQDTRDACNLYPSLYHVPENNDQWDDQLDLGVNFDWSKRKVTLPHAWTIEQVKSFLISPGDPPSFCSSLGEGGGPQDSF